MSDYSAGEKEKQASPGAPGDGRGQLVDDIGRIYRSEQLDEATKDRLISELLPGGRDSGRIAPGQLAAACLASLLLPPSGLIIGTRFLIRHEEEGRRPAAACFTLTLVSLFILSRVLRAWLSPG